MSNSVTVTVQLDGESASPQSFALGNDGAAPPPPAGMTGEDSSDASGDNPAPPPSMDADETKEASSASGSDAGPPDFDASFDVDGDDPVRDRAQSGDSPPPPDV